LLIHFLWAQTRNLKLIVDERTENLSKSNRSLVNEISERKQAKKALKKSETHLRTLIDSLPDLVWLKDPDGAYLSCNSKFERFFGAKEADIIGKTDYDFVDEKLADLFRENDKIAMAAGRPSMNEEIVTYADDGHTEILETLKSPMVDHEGKLIGILGVGRDITRRKEEEEEKIKLKTELQQAQKMESIGRLAGGVAHDFNNMLSIIQGNTDLLIEDTDPLSPAIDHLHEIQKAADRSVNLTRQLLAFARKQTIAPKLVNFNKAVEGMLKMLGRLIGEDIELKWVPSETLWPITIDPSQIDQVLANFCVNARDAIKGVGKVTIETKNVSFDEAYCSDHAGFKPGDYVMMAFSDDGCGMDNNTLENIFEPFFTTKGAGQGTGLGLATIYGIVKQNSGFINVYSEPGQGTTFKIYFPRYNHAIPKAEILNSKKTTETGHETILLVEDEKAILKTTSMTLERLGYRVLSAATPEEAVRIAEESGSGDIHLLITDVVMPEMNGRDLSKRILHLCPDIKCIFMSGYTANVIAHHGVLDDGIEFLNKPFSKQELASRIREVLDQGK
jgi:PAS domain S-box-containing protein